MECIDIVITILTFVASLRLRGQKKGSNISNQLFCDTHDIGPYVLKQLKKRHQQMGFLFDKTKCEVHKWTPPPDGVGYEVVSDYLYVLLV